MLCVCTANMCRSPLLEVFLGSELRARGADAHVHSAGTLADGRGAVRQVVDAASDRGHDLTAHRSRRLDAELVDGADLVLPLAREHLREIVLLSPEAFVRTFTPKELVRRAGLAGGRRPDETLDEFLARLHEGRTARELLGDDPADDVVDPIGGPRSGYERAADEIQQLAAAIAALVAPLGTPVPTAVPTAPTSTTANQES